MSLGLLHDRLSVTAALFAFAMGAWALVLVLRGRGVDGSYLGAVVVGELLLVSQAVTGAGLWFLADARPERDIHLLYGTAALLVWPFALTFARREGSRRDALLLAAASLFLWGVVLRAAGTARPGS